MAEQYKSLKVQELKDLLSKEGLPTTGKKDELIDRLVKHNQMEADFDNILPKDGADETLADFDDKDLGLEDLLDTDIKPATTTTTKPADTIQTSASAAVQSKPATKAPSSADDKPNAGPVQSNNDVRKAAPSKPTEGAASVQKPTTAAAFLEQNLDILDEDSKKKLERAKRFGMPVPQDIAKKVRAARFGTGNGAQANGAKAAKKSIDPEVLKKRQDRFGIVNPKAKTAVAPKPVDPVEEEKRRKRAERFGQKEEAKKPKLDFSNLKKKKKKSKKVDLPEDEPQATPEPEEEAPVEDNAAADEKPEAEGDDLDAEFAALKKKKKKKVPKADFEESVEGAASEEAVAEEEFGLGDLKKKKKKKKMADFEAELDESNNDDMFGTGGNQEDGEEEDDEPWLKSDRDYYYPELLNRVFKIILQNNPELAGEKKRYTIVPPSIHREGNKRTIFANVADICKRMHRSPEHVIQFLFSELGTSGSVDGSQRLVIKGRFQQKQIENVLRRYIIEYVTCKTCKSPDTILVKDNRLYFVQCESCGSSRSVSAIKTGYKAATDRRAVARRAV
ncbi:hypothetical protein BZG36_05254 [Bifiguratus adelaidae]|uniref:SAP domain-containing protein n=1 Tax=Bifiguratus adelaidae TaxID=1938954 RepID=A0A261XUL8_9FUNG|nr:hypothetical protein BZG36_05254 [Bifiguratus adelaidae]